MTTTEALAAINKTIMEEVAGDRVRDLHAARDELVAEKPHGLRGQGRGDRLRRARRRPGVRAEQEGEEADWADRLAWEPHERFLVRWRVNPERGPTELEIRFTPEGAKTRVDLEHRG